MSATRKFAELPQIDNYKYNTQLQIRKYKYNFYSPTSWFNQVLLSLSLVLLTQKPAKNLILELEVSNTQSST